MATINGMDVKREIAERRPKGEDRLALLSGFVRSVLSLVMRGGEALELGLDCQTDFVRDYISALMHDEFKLSPKDSDGQLCYADGMKILRALHIVGEDDEFCDGIPDSFALSAHYARGAFLGCGSMSAPHADSVGMSKRAGYHLEFAFNAESLADAFISLLSAFGVAAHKSERAEKYVVYIKDSEGVSDCLAVLGADKSVIRLNEAVAMLAARQTETRRSNAEVANISRAIDAAVDITVAIMRIDERLGLDTLDKKLKEAAEARLSDHDAPLSAIAEKLGISKSGLKHRFDKIIEIARSLSDGKEGA